MRNTSFLAALMVLIGVSSLNLSGCVDPNDDDDSVVDDDDTGDDDDSTGVVFAPMFLPVTAEMFMGYNGNGAELGNTSLGIDTPEFDLWVNGEQAFDEIEVPGDRSTIEFETVSQDGNAIHATYTVKQAQEGLATIKIDHHRDYTGVHPPSGDEEVDANGHVSFTRKDGEPVVVQLNYDATGTWVCVTGGITTPNSVTESFGEMFSYWFEGSGIPMFAHGCYLNGSSGNSEWTGTISSNGSEFIGELWNTGIFVNTFRCTSQQ